MQSDPSKFFLFLVLSLVVLVLVFDKRRPLANAPLAASNSVDDVQTADDTSAITRGPGFANVATYHAMDAKLALMVPRSAVEPTGGCGTP